MNKTLMIMRHEITTLTSRFSFWFGLVALPLIGFAIYAVVGYINSANAGGENAAPLPIENVTGAFTEEEDNRPVGYVDQAGLVQKLPAGFPEAEWIRYASDKEARAALDIGTIGAYFVIPGDYIKTGLVTVYMPEFKVFTNDKWNNNLSWMLSYNLLKGDTELADAVSNPIRSLERVSLAPPEAGPERNTDNMWTFFIPYGVMMLFYMAILGTSGMLLNSVSKEKENRTMEVLLLSARPHQLLMGKIIGLGLIGLLQMAIWGLSAVALLRLSGQTFNLPADASLPPSILAWGLVFFVLGYMVYAALMAGLGALVPNLREASQATTIVVIPLIIPLFLISALIENPNSPLAVGLSLFPLTAPTTMMLRLAAVNVPLWQPILAAVLCAVTAFLVVRAVANMFRAQTLLSGQPFKVKRFFLALAGK